MDRPVAFGPKTVVAVACPDREGGAWLAWHFAEWYGALALKVVADGGHAGRVTLPGDEAYAVTADASDGRLPRR